MSADKEDNLDFSVLGTALPFNAPSLSLCNPNSIFNGFYTSLSAEERACLADARKRLLGQHSDVLESLSPTVRKRVEVLKEIQSEHDELEAKYFEERAALDAKYQKLYEPLYAKRNEIVIGIIDVEGVMTQAAEEGQTEDKTSGEKGVPDFWLTAMKTNEVLAEEIQEADEGALKFLKDIKWCRIDNPNGFKLEFFFDPNPYFKNTVLTKTYHMVDDEEPILNKAIGTEIEWYPGKCLGVKNANATTKTENCESFFVFFNPPELPAYNDDIDKDTDEQLQKHLEKDYDVGSTIRDEIIPHAVSWFTGEAVQEDDSTDDDDDDKFEDDFDEYLELTKRTLPEGGRTWTMCSSKM